MSFGDVVSIMLVYGACLVIGAVFGAVLKDIFGRFTMLVLTCMHISVFVALVCMVGECGILEMFEELFDMAFVDGMLLVMLPVVTVFGSKIGQNYRINIERR